MQELPAYLDATVFAYAIVTVETSYFIQLETVQKLNTSYDFQPASPGEHTENFLKFFPDKLSTLFLLSFRLQILGPRNVNKSDSMYGGYPP